MTIQQIEELYVAGGLPKDVITVILALKKENERLETLNGLLKFQIEVLEHNIDLLDYNYQILLNDLTTDDRESLENGIRPVLKRLPESLKPQIEFPEFQIIEADPGQNLSHTEISIHNVR